MDTADLDEAQSKKVFRARKTMKISDRLQLESIHNSHSSSALPSSSTASCSSTPPPAVLNGKYPEEEQTEDQKVRESHTDSNPKETQPTPPVPRTPSPLTLSLSLSPSPPSQSPEKLSYSNACLSPAHSPNSVGKESDGKERDDKEEKETSSLLGGVEAGDYKKTEEGEVKEKEDSAGSQVKDEEDENRKPDGDVSSPLDSPQDPAVSSVPPLASETKDKENKIETEKRTESEEAVAMDTDPAPMETKALEVDKSTPAADAISSTSPSLSPSHAPESDLEVKEGFLVLSEEDENQGEKDEAKVKQEVKIEAGEEMEVDVKKVVDMKKEEDREDIKDTAPPSHTSSPAPPPSADPEADKCHTNLCGKKRALCGDVEMDREKEKGEEEEGLVRDGKRLKVEGEELEAQLELKIRADTSSRLKLEKVVQQLVEEQLRVLQLSVFDRSLQELRERVEKIDCATKHQQTLNTLQAKISRLAKKFGAANQTKENIQKPQEGTSLTPATNTLPISATSTTSTFRSVRTTVDSKPTNPKPKANPLNATASPAQPKPLSTPTPPASSPMVSAPVPLLITTTTASGTTSSVSSLAPVTSQNQTGTLLLKTTLANNNGVSQSGPMSAAQSVSLQPLLIQLPLAVTGAQGGSVVTNHNAGVELIPVSSLGTVGTLNKAKTTTATTYILQKTTPSSSASSLPPSPSLPQITLARAVYPGGSGTVSVPSSGVSVSTARTPTQCVSVVGVTSSSSLPVSSAPAATGGQATVGPPSATVMASKTDNQATNSAASKPSAQASRASSSRAVIDLTEDDDDVQVTGVQKAPVQSGLNAASSVSPASQHSTGAPPPLISSTTQLGPEASGRTRSLSQGSPPFSQPPLSKPLLPFTVLVNMAAREESGSTIRSSPQGGLHSVNGPPVTVPYRSPQNSPSKIRPANPSHQLPPLPSLPPAPTRLPPEATHTSLPQQPQLKLTRVQNQNGIVLSWFVEETDRTCAAVDSYHLYAFHRDHASAPQSQWKKIGEVKALPLPMACTLTQFVSGSTYYFAVCARDIYSRFGPFCEPQCTDVISSSPSS